MKQKLKWVFFLLPLAFMLGGHVLDAFLLNEPEVRRDPPELLSVHVLDDFQYKLCWSEAFGGQKVSYLLFAADDALALMPLASAQSFLHAPHVTSLFMAETSQLSILCQCHKRYLRLIAHGGEECVDVAALIDLKNFSQAKEDGAVESIHPEIFEKRPYKNTLSESEWSLIAPYLIPANHRLKAQLDSIFSKSTPLASLEQLQKAGFVPLVVRSGRGLIVARHPMTRKYLFKIYLDDVPKAEWPLFVNRAKGARTIQKVIDEKNYDSELKVPNKWLYALPKRPQVKHPETSQIYPKFFILLVEDMYLTDEETSRNYYKQRITRAQLKALCHIIHQCGLSDSHIDNIPFSHDLRIAFIDTEYVHVWPVHPEWISKHLAAKSQRYWQELIKNVGRN